MRCSADSYETEESGSFVENIELAEIDPHEGRMLGLTTPAKEPPICSSCQRPLVGVYSQADLNYATFNPETGKYEWNTNPEQASFYCEECNKPLGEEEIIIWESLA